MTCGNPIKHKLQNVFDNWIDMFSVKKNYLMIKWNVCNSVFVIMCQDKLRRFPSFIIDCT